MSESRNHLPSSASKPQDENGASEPYESYKRFTLKLQEISQRRRETLAAELRKDPYRDHSAFLERLREERGQRFLMTQAEFDAWWSTLTLTRQEEFLDLYHKEVTEVLEETKEALLEAFESRRPESWQTS